MHGLEPVAHIGKGAADHDRGGVVGVGAAHHAGDVDIFDPLDDFCFCGGCLFACLSCHALSSSQIFWPGTSAARLRGSF